MLSLELNQKPFIELQIEALANENKIRPKNVNKFIDTLEEKLSEIKKSNYAKLLKRPIRIPLIGRPNCLGLDDYPRQFEFVPPSTIDVVGGFKTLTAIQKTNFVDLAVAIPSQCFDKKDIKNQKYHKKRALYLAQLASLLISPSTRSGFISRVEFKYHQGDFLKPVLLITPECPTLKDIVTFQLFAYPEQNFPIKLSQLHPSHGNVAPKWFFKDYNLTATNEGIEEFMNEDSNIMSSPFYNSNILFDIEMIANSDLIHEQIGSQSSITEALMLIKIWLYQRELHQHFSFVVSMFVAYLQTRQTIHQNMSSYQIFKVIIKSIAESDWDQTGLSYYEDSNEKIESFKLYFPVTFLSPSGNLNLCYNITIDLYRRLKHEASLSHGILLKNLQETFELLFLKKLTFTNKFDVIVHIPKCNKKLPMKLEYLKKFADHGVFTPRVYSQSILELVEKSLMDRVVLIQQSSDHFMLNKSWRRRNKPYDYSSEENTFTFGLLLEPEKSLRIMDIGPEAKTEEAEEFRKFWEPKCQLRLQNGIISETVVWHVDNFSQRRAIIKYILLHALRHADIRNIIVHYTLLEKFINIQNVYFKWRNDSSDEKVPKSGTAIKRKHNSGGDENDHDETTNQQPIGVGEEIFQKLLHGYNELNRIVRNVDNLKHSITSIQPFSQHLRSSSVFPPLPVSLQRQSKSLKKQKGVTLVPESFDNFGKILYIDPIEIMITLDTTGRWPNDLEAFEAAKMEYLIQLGEALKEKEYTVKFAENYLDILHGQFVYRLRLKISKELTLVATACGKQEFQKRRLELEVLPRVHSSLDQLYREKTSFGLTCRIVKRWLSSNLMTDHLSDITIDLLVANTYLHPEPYTEPSSSICGFRRFLLLIASHDWKQQPLIVNFENQLKLDEINRLRDSMSADRTKFPPMVICTPHDKDTSPWTKSEPSQEKLIHMIKICRRALLYLAKNIIYNMSVNHDDCIALFRPNFKLFDILIKLKPEVIQNSFLRVDTPKKFKLVGKELDSGSKTPSALNVMPIVGMNLIEQFVKLLHENYGTKADFFYDKFGQRLIGVILKSRSEQLLESEVGKLISGFKKLGSTLIVNIKVIKHKEIRKIIY